MKRLILTLTVALLVCLCAFGGELKIRFFSSEVAEYGDAAFLQFPNGENMLIDMGVIDNGYEIASWLKSKGITTVDYAVFSHCHSDHVNGFASLLDSGITVKVLYSSGYFPTNYRWALGRIDSNNIDHRKVTAGDSFDIGDVHFDVLWPRYEDLDFANLGQTSAAISGTGSNNDMNNHSLVLKITYGNTSALFTGDIYTDGEADLVAMYAYDPTILDVDVLKVPHHGKATSSSQALFDATTPVLAATTGQFQMGTKQFGIYVLGGATVTQSWMNGNVDVVMDGTTVTWTADKEGYIPLYQKYYDAFMKKLAGAK